CFSSGLARPRRSLTVPTLTHASTDRPAMIRVLHAEDDPQLADIVRLLFDQHGAEFSLAHVASGHACLNAMQRGAYDVLLLDLMMPDIDGLNVLGELTARRDLTPVVMVSAQGQHELAVRALRAGAVDCIDK